MSQADKLVDRLDFLCKNVPLCESCGADQVQLIDWNYPPAPWRCRKCKHGWYHEPIHDS